VTGGGGGGRNLGGVGFGMSVHRGVALGEKKDPQIKGELLNHIEDAQRFSSVLRGGKAGHTSIKKKKKTSTIGGPQKKKGKTVDFSIRSRRGGRGRRVSHLVLFLLRSKIQPKRGREGGGDTVFQKRGERGG